MVVARLEQAEKVLPPRASDGFMSLSHSPAPESLCQAKLGPTGRSMENLPDSDEMKKW